MVFLAFQDLKKVFRLMYGNICLNQFLQSYPEHQEQRCEWLRYGSEEGTSSPPPPVFSQVPSQLLHPYPWTPNLVCLPQQDLGASSPTYVDAPGKEPALQGLKSGLFHPEGSTDSFEAISPLYKSLLVLRITEQIHCNGSIGTWPVGSPWL